MLTIKRYPLFLLLILTMANSCKPRQEVLSVSNRQYIIGTGGDTIQNKEILELTQIFRDSLNSVMNEPLIYNKVAMTKELPEGNLGNFCSDLWLKAAREICKQKKLPAPDIAVFNHGGLRSSLPAGMITVRNVFELMPFENELVVCALAAGMKDSLLNTIAKKGGAPIAGFRFQLSNGKTETTPWSNLTDSIYVVTSDYLASGNDNFGVFKTGRFTTLQIKLRDVLLEEIRKLKTETDTISIQKDGRILLN